MNKKFNNAILSLRKVSCIIEPRSDQLRKCGLGSAVCWCWKVGSCAHFRHVLYPEPQNSLCFTHAFGQGSPLSLAMINLACEHPKSENRTQIDAFCKTTGTPCNPTWWYNHGHLQHFARKVCVVLFAGIGCPNPDPTTPTYARIVALAGTRQPWRTGSFFPGGCLRSCRSCTH
jgi:hypothetical protein